MHKKFDSSAIENKWQEKWRESGIYNVKTRDPQKEKEYILVEWPYPSGNLHIGHWYAFAVPDIYARFKRMTGKQVIFPMGFDAFGLPAENAAIKNNVNPRVWTEGNIEYMQKQLDRMGASFSWDRTTSSINPDYYKWTQWMFTKFFENDIAYRGEGVVNWCPKDNTVIANEQVSADGTCERCGSTIEKKKMPQWMLRITKYADRLVNDLDKLNWPEHIKEAQRQWIGKSDGAKLAFNLSTGDKVEVFTTRIDTLFGVTYLVLAPEHPLVKQNQSKIENWSEVENYIVEASKTSEQDRLANSKDKTGVKLDGLTAINPINNEVIPVFISDYVLANYGTGAIMAVPAHDERDYVFAKKFDLPIKNVLSAIESTSDTKEEIFSGEGTLVNSGEFDGLTTQEAKKSIVEKVNGKSVSTYRLRDWSIGRQRYWGVPIPIVYDPEGKAHVVPKEHLPWLLPEDVDPTPTGVAPLDKSLELKKRTEDIFGTGWTPEVETMDTFVDSSWYFLRYIDNKNDMALASLEAQIDWMPIDIYFGGAEHTTMHLLYSRFWQKALFDLGLVNENEPYKRRVNRGLILGPDGNKMSKSKGNVIDPDEQVKLVGSDTVKMYLAFMGPYEGANYPWDMGGIAGLRRFLERVYGLKDEIKADAPTEISNLLHKTIKKVRSDIADFKFNTAISSMMIFVNESEKAGLTKTDYETFVKVLAPFAPHLTEEIWSNLGKTTSIHLEQYPEFDETLTQDKTITIGVQINGKVRGSIEVAPTASEAEVVILAQNSDTLAKYLENQVIKKIIYIPGRILNLII